MAPKVKGPGEQEQVDALIKSVKQHKNFKQMCTYNLSCLCAMITPPNVGWMENIQYAIESGAIDSIIDVLKQHPAALEVVRISIEALRKLAIDAKNAEAMAKAGAVPVALDAMLKSGVDDVAEAGGELIATIAAHAPDALLDNPGTIEALVGALNKGGSTKIMASVLNTLDRVARTDRGLAEIRRAGGLQAVLAAIGKGKVCSEEMLRPAFRLLERFARDPEAVKEIRKNGGVQALVAQLEAHSSNEGLLRAGGRLLAIIAEDDLENTVQTLNESNLSPEAREFMTALISNLMLRPDNIDKVIKAGGIKAILRGFGQFTDATKEASARALGRMANNPENIKQLIKEGAVEVLASAVANAGDNEGLLTAATKALGNMVIDKETAKEVEERGGAAAVLKKLKEHPELKEFAAEALALFENMAKAGHDMSGLVQLGLVKAIIDSMKASPLDTQVQLHGFGALEHMLRDTANHGKTGNKVGHELVGCGGVPVLGSSLAAQAREPAVVGAGLKTLTEFMDWDPKAALKACAAADTTGAVVTAVYANQGNRVIDDLAKPLLGKMVTVKDAENCIGNIKKHAMAVCSTKSDDSTDKLEHALQSATVFAKVKSLADAMMKVNAAPIVLGAWKDVIAVGADVPRLDDVIDGFASATITLSKSDAKHLKTFFDGGALKVIQEAVKQLPQDRGVGSSLKALKVFATPTELKRLCVEQGAIESCGNAMRTFATSPIVFEPALETLLQLSSNDELATAVVNKGAARGIIKGMGDNCKNPEFEHSMELSLMVLEKAASAAPHLNTVPNLVKQGAINAVIQAMEAYPRNETIEAIGARVLARLLDKQGVSDAVDKMKELVAKLIKSKDPSLLPELSRAMATVGYLALAPENVPIMREKEAAKAVMDALKTIDTLPATSDTAQARKAGFRTLGQMASTAPLPKELGAVPFVLAALKSAKLTPYEKQAVLDCIKSMASSEATALELIDGGAIDDILALMKQHSHDEALVTAALGALSALGEYERGAKELAKGREQLLRWFRDNKDTAGPRAMEACMIVLGNMALVDDNVAKMLEAGIIDMIVAAMDFQCSDPHNPQPRVLQAAVSLMGRLATTEAAIKQLNNKGALRRAIEIARSSPVYLGDADAMEALIFLLESCAMVESVRPDLVRAGATEMIMEAMNLNAGNEEVVVTGARALQTLLGSSPDTVKQLLKDVADIAAKLKKNPNDRDLQDALDRALQNLANLILVPGLVDNKGAADIAHSLADLLGLLGGMAEGPAKSKLIARTVQALGRLPLVEGLTFDESEALKRLVEALRQNPDDSAVLEQALLAMSNMLTNPKALKPLTALGGLDDIARILATASDDAKLREAALRVWQRAKEIVETDPLSVDPATLKAFFKTQQEQNPTDFASLFKRMAQAAGPAALTRSFGLEPGGEISADLLRALREHLQGQGTELRFEDPNHLKALLEALRGKKGTLTPAERANMLERQKEALKLLGLMGKDGLLDLARQGGIEALLKMMMDNIDDPDICQQILGLFNRMMGYDPDLLAKMLMQNGAMEKIKEVLKRHGDNPAVVKEAIKLLNALQKQLGLDKMGADEELLKLIAAMNDKFGAELNAKDLLDGLRNMFTNEDPALISARLDKLLGMDLANNIVERRGDDGKVYYYDKTTGETSWQKPQAYAAVISAMEGLAKLTEAHKEAIQAVNPKALTAAVNQFETHASEPARLTALAKALATLASNNENRNAIAKAGGLQAIVMALNSDQLDAEFVDAAMALLNQFSKNDGFRDDIAKLGGIKALIKIMLKFIDHQHIVEKCLSALANLGYNSDVNVKEIITHGGIAATLKVMQRWKDATSTLQLALVLLNNCMYGSKENKLRVGKEGGQEIINVVQRHYKDVRTLNAANKALGNLSVEDPNIRLLVDAHAVKYIVQGMDAHPAEVAAQQIAIDVIGNFASIQEDALEAQIARGEVQSVFHIIVHEQGAARIIKTVKETSEIQLLMSGMDALANLASDKFATERMLKMGIVAVVVEAMAAYDWDEELMARTVRLLATLTFNQEGVKEIVVRDGIQVLLSGMESHIDEPEFLKSAVIALKNIAQEPDFRAEIEKLQGIETVLAALDRHLAHRPLVMEMLSFFTRMTPNKLASEAIATKGMHCLLKAINGRAQDADFLTRAFILLGHLAFHDPNLKIIAQYGGVGLILQAICDHPEAREMLSRAVQTLDNIAMASQEHAKIVTAEGGVEAIKAVMEAYADDPELVKVCKAALISMTALETRAAKPRRDFLNKETDGYTIGEDPLVEHRNLLKAGSLLTEWSNGGPNIRHVAISPDFTMLVWKDPKKTGKQHTMLLRDIRLIRDAAGDGHTKLKKKADSQKSFSVVGRAMTLDFEASTVAEHKAWVAALGAVLHCVRKDQQWLK